MSNFKISWSLQDNTRLFEANMRQSAGQVVRATAQSVADTARESMSEPKSGIMYGAHQASAPGEAPAIDTGFLVNSIRMEPAGDLTAYVNVGADYGPHLEYGTVHMAARPFLLPAMTSEEPAFVRRMEGLFGTR